MAGYADFEEDETDIAQSRTYKLTSISKPLAAEIEAFKARRTQVICRHRYGRAVQSTTVESDIGCLLRLLGWMRSYRDRSDDEGDPPPLTMKGVIGSADFGLYTEQYVEWLQARDVKFSSIANYTNSLVSLLTYVMGDEDYEVSGESGFTIHEQLCNIRRQAHSAASIDRMYRRRDPNWLEWPQCQEVRMDCIEKYERAKGAPVKKLNLLRDVVALSAFTCLPPDRVGVIRLLRFDHTLRWIPDDEEEDPDGPGAWFIDLTSKSNKHKTSRFYGPAMTRLPDTFGHYIGVYKDARASAASFDFEDSGGGYLFEGRDGRPFSVSTWTTVVKDTWKRHCGLSPPPKLLRAIFICWLRDQAHENKATPEILKVYPPLSLSIPLVLIARTSPLTILLHSILYNTPTFVITLPPYPPELCDAHETSVSHPRVRC
mmetsp:Transcript_103697/g.297996  ORF Transcript_103697/g.297996 Transcript_103697/m.297996 type:complete len:429 (-) Transcript_103697:954-2240(-)